MNWDWKSAIRVEFDNDPHCVQIDAFLQSLHEPKSSSGDLRILLLHTPMYRLIDHDCGVDRHFESDRAESDQDLSKHNNVLSKFVTQKLLERVQPNLVFSGRLQSRCIRTHDNGQVIEVTLPTYSWRLRPDPSFAVLTVSDNLDRAWQVAICQLPNSFVVILMYILAGLCFAAALLVRYAKKDKSALDLNKTLVDPKSH